jgi:signal peptidase II
MKSMVIPSPSKDGDACPWFDAPAMTRGNPDDVSRCALHTAPVQTLWIAAGVSFLLSLAGKWLADAWLHAYVPVLGGFAGFTYTTNPGIAFSITFAPFLQTPLILAALGILTYVAFRSAATRWSRIGFGMIIGGALGNVADRVRDGVVTDFIQVGTFPVFNVADSCITVGVAVLIIEMVLQKISGDPGGKRQAAGAE